MPTVTDSLGLTALLSSYLAMYAVKFCKSSDLSQPVASANLLTMASICAEESWEISTFSASRYLVTMAVMLSGISSVVSAPPVTS